MEIDPAHFQPRGPVVCINTAATQVPFLPIDFWAVLDPPRKFVWIRDEWPEGTHWPVIWCRDSQFIAWNELGFKVWHHPSGEEEFKSQFVKLAAKMDYTSLTIFATLARCIAYGARKVILYGCDMAGVGYGTGNLATDQRLKNPSMWTGRWKDERRMMKIATDQWTRCLGVEFEFVPLRSPPPLGVPAVAREPAE